MRITAPIKLVSISVLTALMTVMAALPANAKARGASKAQKEIMAIKWHCDAKNLAKLDQLIKEGAKRKLQKKDLDWARYRHGIAKRTRNEKDKALCLAALQSGARILAFAKQNRPPARRCADVMKNIPRMIARGDEANAPAKKLFGAEAEYARAQKALKLRGKTNANSRNTLCLKHADAANKIMVEVEQWIQHGIRANLAARQKCPYGDSRACSSWKKKAKNLKPIGPSEWLVCNAKGYSDLETKIRGAIRPPLSKAAPTARKHLAAAKRSRSKRDWKTCQNALAAGRKAFTDAQTAHAAAEGKKITAAEKAAAEAQKRCSPQDVKAFEALIKTGQHWFLEERYIKNAKAGLSTARKHDRAGRKVQCKQVLNAARSELEKGLQFNSVQRKNHRMEIFKNWDIPGKADKVVSNMTAEACGRMCRVSHHCYTFTFGAGTCYLKNYRRQKAHGKAAPNVTSGLKRAQIQSR